MSSQGKTKRIILELIRDGVNNLSAISKRLNLAPSTVSKHLHDLEESGAIIYDENPHFRKWKNYVINKEFTPKQDRNIITPMKNVIVGAVILFVIVFTLLYFYYGSSASSVYVPISITDPPQVPLGTQSLYINYSSFYVNVANGNVSKWIYVNSSGSINLMGIINTSAVIGGITLPENSFIKGIKFNINAARIIINNISYNVKILNNNIDARISNYTPLNHSGILLDFYPTVVPIYTNNSASFLLVPSIYATRYTYNGSDIKSRFKPYGRMNAIYTQNKFLNLSITSNASVSKGSAKFNILVKNTLGKNLTIMCIRIIDKNNNSMYFKNSINLNETENSTGGYPIMHKNSTILINESLPYRSENYSIIVNGTVKRILIIRSNMNNVPSPEYANMELLVEHTNYFDMLVMKNGSLALPLPFMRYNNNPFQNAGYALNVNMSKQFNFSINDNLNINKNDSYTILIITNYGIAYSSVNVV